MFQNFRYNKLSHENLVNLEKWNKMAKSENENRIEEIIAVVHLTGDLSGISLLLFPSAEKKNTHPHTCTYIHANIHISRRPSTATRNFVHERPEDWLVVNPISACGFEVVFPTRSSSSYHRCSRCQGLLGSSFFTLNNFPFGWTIRVHPTSALPTV